MTLLNPNNPTITGIPTNNYLNNLNNLNTVNSINKLVIATRSSKLALWQSEHIATQLRVLYPFINIELLPMSTKGDEILDRSLSKIGGKGLFIKELEHALLEGRADLAVHSLKDMPVDLHEAFCLAAVPPREDARDALVGCADLALLPPNSVIGTSSLRRAAQILRDYPLLRIEPLRGNLDTRLSKLDRGDYAAIVLAASGLKRLGYQARIAGLLAPSQMLPAAGQGALGVECLSTRPEVIALLTPLGCAITTMTTQAERAVGLALGASCSTPLAAYSWLEPVLFGDKTNDKDNKDNKDSKDNHKNNHKGNHYDDSNIISPALTSSSSPWQQCLQVWAGNATGTVECAGLYRLQAGETPKQLGQRVGQTLIDQGALSLLNNS